MYIKKSLLIILLCSLFVTGLFAGKALLMDSVTIDSSSSPGSTLSYRMSDLYSRLSSGALCSQSTFTEPTVAPGTPTMPTLNDIMAEAPYPAINGATPSQVEMGFVFWGLRGGCWGRRMGTREPSEIIR